MLYEFRQQDWENVFEHVLPATSQHIRDVHHETRCELANERFRRNCASILLEESSRSSL